MYSKDFEITYLMMYLTLVSKIVLLLCISVLSEHFDWLQVTLMSLLHSSECGPSIVMSQIPVE